MAGSIKSSDSRLRAEEVIRAVSSPVGASLGLGAGLALLATGYLASERPGSALAPLAVIAGALGVAAMVQARWRWGVLVGVLILAGINVLPGPDLTTHSLTTGFSAQEGIVFLLIFVLLADIVVHRLWGFYATATGRLVLLLSLANLSWWLYTFARTSELGGITTKHAFNFSVSFLLILVLTPLLAASFSRRDTRLAAVLTVGLVGLIPAAFFFVGSVAHSSFTAFTHGTAHAASGDGGVSRLFSPAHDLFTAAFPVAAAAAVMISTPRWRRIAALVAVVDLAAIAVGQTRAQYLLTVAGFGIASLFYLRGTAGRSAGKRIAKVVGVLAVLVAVLLVTFPNAAPSTTIKSLGSRVGSIYGTVSSSNTSTSTVAVRNGEETLLKQRLGSHWLLGLGFVDPTDEYDANLPFGSIDNTDIGISAVIMTMGVIGTALYYLPLFAVILILARPSRYPTSGERWLVYGVLAALIGVLVGSFTLTTFVSTTGIVSVAGLIALGAAAPRASRVSDNSAGRTERV